MKNLVSLATLGFLILGGLASPLAQADQVTLQLKWVTQAQFAGYYIALDKGFYSQEGLEVTIEPGGPDVAAIPAIADGHADVIVEWMPPALAARERGIALVNIAQPFKSSGMMLVCRKGAGVATSADFRGKKIAVWFSGSEYPFLNWMSQLGIPVTGGPDGVEMLRQDFSIDALLQKQVACISAMSYNEFLQVMDAGVPPEELVTLRYEEQGVATLEDGLYVLEERLDDPAFRDRMVRFVRASLRGWRFAVQHPEEAVRIILDNDSTGTRTERHQTRMMREVARLVAGTDGSLDPADYQRTVATLLAGDSDPVITREPESAWTHEVTDEALDY